jgi:hypothetical protein
VGDEKYKENNYHIVNVQKSQKGEVAKVVIEEEEKIETDNKM